jgi:hypothetical protein
MNPGACASGGVCGDTDDAGEVEAECEASGVSGGEEWYGIAGLGTIGGASFETETRVVKDGIEELELELTLLLVLG